MPSSHSVPTRSAEAMKLVDMKRDTADADDDLPGDVPEAPRYPSGLRLTLDDGALERLGLDDVAVGDTVTLSARAKVVAYSETADDDTGDVTCRLELQITALGVDEDADGQRKRRDDD